MKLRLDEEAGRDETAVARSQCCSVCSFLYRFLVFPSLSLSAYLTSSSTSICCPSHTYSQHAVDATLGAD